MSGKYNITDSEYSLSYISGVATSPLSSQYYSDEYEITNDGLFKLINPTNGYTENSQVLYKYTLCNADALYTSDRLYRVELSNATSSGYMRAEYKLIGKYAHIVGNGTSTSACSNAHTLDWEGNAWYQGDVYVGSTSGTNKDDGSKKLATEEYVDNLVGDTTVTEQINTALENSKPDWNQNNEGASDYVKNRTHWTETETVALVQDVSVTLDVEMGYVDNPFEINLVEGQTYEVIWDGTSYSCVAYFLDGEVPCYAIGDRSGNSEPFFYLSGDNGAFLYISDAETHTISIYANNTTIHKLDPKYLPDGGVGYSEFKSIDIQEVSVEISEAGDVVNNPFAIDLVEGETYEVTWNGTLYSCVAYIAEGPNTPSIGNGSIANVSGGGNEPFFCTVYNGNVMLFADTAGTHTISILSTAEAVHKIEEKYLSIIETKVEKVIEVENVGNGELIEDPSIKIVKSGKGIITIDGVSETSNFVDCGSYSIIETRFCTISFYDGEAYVQFPYDGNQAPEHHVIVERVLETVKEENLPENILLKGDAVPMPTTAQVGQFLKVSAVDENGVITAVEAVSITVDENGVLTLG